MAKSSTPKFSAIVPRKRLFTALDESLSNGSVWIGAQPGAGKTALVGSYLAARRLPVLWYQVAAADADPSTFFYRLAQEAERFRPRPRSRAPLPLFTPEYAADLAGFAGRFFTRLFERFKPPGAIVFDNVNEVRHDAPLAPILRALLDVVPPGVRIICTSRESPPDALARATAYGTLRVIGWEELALESAETVAIAAVHGVTEPKTVAALHRRCGGWVAGLTLLLQRTGGGAMPAHAPSRAMFGYFAGEVLERLSRTASDVLIRAAFFPQFSKEMVIALTANADAAKIVAGLVRSGYFVSRSEGPEPRYRFHDLFREFLLATGLERLSGEGYSGVARHAATLLDKDGQIEAAVKLYCATDDWIAVARIALREAHPLIEQGRWQTLMGWISCLPPRMLDEEPWLRFWLAICRLTTNPPDGRTELEAAYAGFAANNNKAGQATAAGALIESFGTQFADIERADHWIDALNALVREGIALPPDLAVRVHINLLAGLLSRRPGDPQLARMDEWLRQFFEAPLSRAQKLQLVIIIFPYAYWHADAAQMKRLVGLIEQLSAPPEATPLSQIFGAITLMFHAAVMGDLRAAREIYTRNIKVANDFGLGFTVPMLNSFYAYAALYNGDMDIVRQVTGENAVAHAPTTDATSYGHFQIFSARLAAHRGDRAGAIAAAAAFRGRLFDTGMLHGPQKAYSCAMLAVALEQAGAIQEARDLLACAGEDPTAYTNQFPMVDCHLYFVAAACAFDSGEEEAGLTYLRSAFRIAAANDYPTITSSPRLSSLMFAQALERGIETEYVRNTIFNFRLAPPSLDLEKWPWPVQVYAFGRFEVLVDGKPLVYGRKRPVRPLELLKYLVAQGAREAPETRIADALWPDLEGDEALNALAINVHRLRRLLGQAEAIVYQGRSVGLNPQCVWSDVAAFERQLEAATGAKGAAEREALQGSALALYRGELLPDDDSASWLIPIRDRLRARSGGRST